MKELLRVGTLVGLLAAACGGQPTSPSTSSLSAGQWTGTTTQGTAISFTVSSDEFLTSLSVGHNFNGCTGMQTFSNLHVATTPDVVCIPGPCSSTITTSRRLSFRDGTPGAGPSTAVNGLFLPGGRAQGVAAFHDFPGCGTVTGVEWTATRR